MTRGMGGDSPANVANYLKGIDYPTGKRELLAHAQKNGAEQEVLDTLEQLPEQQYENMAEVMKGYGQSH
ncbi:DUF2795 domain-containing protein [Pseudomonas sp. AA-38]|uniref:DUF2795 domain-containing protein n=1 Tax=Pseudomonas sp. AA-38 TaxID=3028807 RepID=UPI0023F79EC4|nr:DUF2795 domain-containing protein [Pseudomonas sp. AA-38]